MAHLSIEMNQNMRNVTRQVLHDSITKYRLCYLLRIFVPFQCLQIQITISTCRSTKTFFSDKLWIVLAWKIYFDFCPTEKLILIGHGNELSLLSYLFLAVDNGGNAACPVRERGENTEKDREGDRSEIPRDHHQGNWIRHFSNPAAGKHCYEHSVRLVSSETYFHP